MLFRSIMAKHLRKAVAVAAVSLFCLPLAACGGVATDNVDGVSGGVHGSGATYGYTDGSATLENSPVRRATATVLRRKRSQKMYRPRSRPSIRPRAKNTTPIFGTEISPKRAGAAERFPRRALMRWTPTLTK